MSGGPGFNFNSQPDLVASNAAAIAQEVGCGIRKYMESLDCLRGVSFEQLINLSVAAFRAARPPFGETYFTRQLTWFHSRQPLAIDACRKFYQGNTLNIFLGHRLWCLVRDADHYDRRRSSWEFRTVVAQAFRTHEREAPTSVSSGGLRAHDNSEHMGHISPQYHRAAQLNRDIWFTCPFLDFTWLYVQKWRCGCVPGAAI
jgi:hypothetical protein